MKIGLIIDNHTASPHGNRQGLSYGELAVLQELLKNYRLTKYLEYSIEKKISYKKVYKGRGSRNEDSSYRRVRQINLILNYERLSTEIESFKTLAGWRLYVTNANKERLS